MKTFEIKALGLEEMSIQEAKITNGGFWKEVVEAVVAVAIYIYEHWEEMQQACDDARNDYNQEKKAI